MNVVVRTDASNRIGTGHLMRCFALGQALQRRGVKLTFVMREAPPSLIAALQNEGFGVRLLPESEEIAFSAQGYEDWLGAPWETDALQTISAIETQGAVDWLIVDHYGIDHRWEERLRAVGCRILVIDDLAIQKHACDLLLNQNLIANSHDRYHTLVPENCRLLVGPRFALLRDEFRVSRNSLNRIRENVEHLLVFLGGGDPDGVTLRVLKAIDRIRPSGLEVTVVLGGANPHSQIIEHLFGHRKDYKIIFQVDNMASLMVEADIAVGAGGISTWERCCLGLPTIVIAIAENQFEVAEQAAKTGAYLYMGWHKTVSDDDLDASLRILKGNSILRTSMSKAGVDLVDGLGCQRVANAMFPKPLRVRPAGLEDAERVFLWRNAEKTRQYSHDPRPLSLEKHIDWFRQALMESNRLLLIGETDCGPVGVLRYDLDAGIATVSIYLDPHQVGQGYGVGLLCAGEYWLRKCHPEIMTIQAEVLVDNVSSRQAFTKAGFVERNTQFVKSLDLALADDSTRFSI